WPATTQELRRLRRPEDQFIYEGVVVGSFEDAILAVLFNGGIQAVVINDGFRFTSYHDAPILHQVLATQLQVDAESVAPQEYGTQLARALKRVRPEVDIYLLSRRNVDSVASEPTGNITRAQDMAARAFGCDRVFFVTNGTSTSNKMVEQALLAPGDIAIVDRNCHKSHHYGMVMAGAQPYYVEAYPMTAYSMYGGVPVRSLKNALLDLKAAGLLPRVRLVTLTSCTFDGHVYNTRRLMA